MTHSPVAVSPPSEESFYSSYDWCLNPTLTLRELFQRFQEEIDRYDTLHGAWQREECRINLYLFVCATSCTVDDWLSRGWAVHHWPVLQWRRQWDACIDLACRILLLDSADQSAEDKLLATLRSLAGRLMKAKIPESLLARRMILPEAYRCQDMTHRDVIALAERFVNSSSDRSSPLLVIGLRTAGSYFAPLTKAFLTQRGFPSVEWISIRPKRGLSAWEQRQMKDVARQNRRVVLVDDYQNTGGTFVKTLALFQKFGIRPERITILLPSHLARPGWVLPRQIDGAERIKLVTLQHADLDKMRLMSSSVLEPLFRPYYGASGELDVRVVPDEHTAKINAELARHFGDSFQVRLKSVAAVQIQKKQGPVEIKRVLAKSVGWGWLGYHAYIAGTRLSGAVPKVIGLRNGFLLTEWIEAERVVLEGSSGDTYVPSLASYIAARVRHLRLPKDPGFNRPTYRWTGKDFLAGMLSRVYSRYVRRLKFPLLYRALSDFPGAPAVLTDGRMRLEEWIQTSAGLVKTDFEQHNFGGGEMDIVDPAYDLASAIFEFQLTEASEEELLRQYAAESGDTAIRDRLLLYKLLCGGVVKMHAAYQLALPMTATPGGKTREEWNARYRAAHIFQIEQMSRSCAGMLKTIEPSWSKWLFFLDLDDVLDHARMGFPHTSWKGLEALALLASHGISTVPNTARSVENVREYCRIYNFPGGIAEFGSVFVDAAAGRETPLIDADAAAQLGRCRDGIRALSGVLIDPGYHFSIRAYRQSGDLSAGLSAEEMNDLLAKCGGDRLTFMTTEVDTTILQKGTTKGSAMRAVKKYLGLAEEPVAAIGNSDTDLDMLQEAAFAYAPANSSNGLRQEAARNGRVRMMAGVYQRGLLEAVQDLIRNHFGKPGGADDPRKVLPLKRGLLPDLLRIADRTPLENWIALLNPRRL